jgi:TRAP-type C4-dicarboxylate transport system substrate-binding protein
MRLFLLLCCLLPFTVQAATTLKLSTLYPEGTSVVKRIKEAGGTITERTDGRVKLKIYPGGTMGDDRAVQRKIRVGQLHGALAQGGAFARYYKDSQVYNLPMAFQSYEEVDYVRKHLDSVLREGFREAGWITFGFIDGGFAYLMSNEPVRTVAQARKQKIWLPANDPFSATLADELDVSPIQLNIGNVLTSLQTGAINALVSPPVAALTLQWHSRVTHLTDMPLMYTYGMLAIHEKYFLRLDESDRQVVRTVMEKALDELDEESRQDNLEAYKAVLNQNVEAVQPENEERRKWKEYADQSTEILIEEGEVSRSLYQRMQALLEEYRNQSTE